MIYVGNETVKHYKPKAALVTDSHPMSKARFPVIDVHCHWDLEVDREKMINAMDERGVQIAVNLSGGHGAQLDQILSRYYRFAPDRFFIFCTPDFSRIDEPQFGQKAAEFLAQARLQGAAGLKIYKDLGLRIKDKSGLLVPVDDPRLDPLWARAGQLNMPVLIHTADPAAFFEPIDRFNERWMQLKRHPNWSFSSSSFPRRETLLAQRNRVIERHPQTIFIGAHVGSSAGDLKALAAVFDKYPNFYVDISGRVAELGRQPYSARAFFIKYQDRILFGTDRYPGRPSQPRYRIYYRFLETKDEYFDYYDHAFPPTGEWKIYGIDLPHDVLEKIYFQNAWGILSQK